MEEANFHFAGFHLGGLIVFSMQIDNRQNKDKLSIKQRQIERDEDRQKDKQTHGMSGIERNKNEGRYRKTKKLHLTL